MHTLLDGLRSRDETKREPLTAGIQDPSWDFEFGGLRFFVSLFAPFYPATHSRWSGDASTMFVLLQPERGFRRFGVSSHLHKRKRLSKLIHARFARHGKHYDLELNTSSPKALRYVKPIKTAGAPIRWWELPVLVDVQRTER